MKSNLIHALLATALLASCSQEDVIQEVDTSQSAIGFTTFVDKATRAETTILSNLETFKVWGTKFRDGNDNAVRIMNATDVTKSGSNWTYSPTKYWVNENAYSFTAIGSSNPDITKYYTYTAPSVEHISYDTYLTHYMGKLAYNNKTANGGADLIWASEKVATIPEDGVGPDNVNFTFGHLLSRVRLKFVNERTIENPDVLLKNVKVTSASSGTLDFSKYNVGVSSTEFEWTPSSDNFDCAFSFLPDNDIEYTLVKNSNVLTLDQFLIPSQGSITVSFDCYTSITKEDGENAKINISKTIKFGDSGSPSPFENLDLKPGYSYTLVAYLTDNLDNSGSINITVEVADYIENSNPAYAMEFNDPSTIYTNGDTETSYQYQTISVKKITTTDELVYYGKTVDPTEINYANYTYEWTIPTNINYTLQKSSGLNGTPICAQTVTNPSSVNDIKVNLYVNGNYSPNGNTTTNTGYIPVTLTVKDNSGSVILSKTVNVPVKYTGSTTGGSQDGDDNDG